MVRMAVGSEQANTLVVARVVGSYSGYGLAVRMSGRMVASRGLILSSARVLWRRL